MLYVGATAAAGGTSRVHLMARFAARVRELLRVVLCMTPIGDNFSACVRTFPALISCVTIDWFAPWPLEALSAIAQDVLAAPAAKPERELESA